MHEENSLTYLKKAYRIRMLITQAFQEIFSENDYVLMPTTTTTAFAIHENLSEEEKATKSFYDDVLTIPMNMTGMPALSLPIGMDSQKLPIGMQIISDYFEESKIYQLASIVEKEFNIFNEMEVFNEE
jgi:aspartyl-tRNA(Asn)/glutamyl-tRNA(Gln) amidotransferase subunit A